MSKEVIRTKDGVEFAEGMILYYPLTNADCYPDEIYRIDTTGLLVNPFEFDEETYYFISLTAEYGSGIDIARCYADPNAIVDDLFKKMEGEIKAMRELTTLQSYTLLDIIASEKYKPALTKEMTSDHTKTV